MKSSCIVTVVSMAQILRSRVHAYLGGFPFGYCRKPLLKFQLHSMRSNDTWLQQCCAGDDMKVWWWCSMHFMHSSLDRHCFSVSAFMMSNVVDCSVVTRFRIRIRPKPNQSTFHFAYEWVLQTLCKREEAVNSCYIARVLYLLFGMGTVPWTSKHKQIKRTSW